MAPLNWERIAAESESQQPVRVICDDKKRPNLRTHFGNSMKCTASETVSQYVSRCVQCSTDITQGPYLISPTMSQARPIPLYPPNGDEPLIPLFSNYPGTLSAALNGVCLVLVGLSGPIYFLMRCHQYSISEVYHKKSIIPRHVAMYQVLISSVQLCNEILYDTTFNIGQ